MQVRSSPVVSVAAPPRRYRVVLVHPSVGVNWSGGSEIFALEMTRRLSADFDVELLSGVPCGPHSRPAGGIPRSHAYRLVKHPLLAPLFKQIASHPEIVIEHATNFLPCLSYLLRRPADLLFPNNDYGGLALAACVRAVHKTPVLFTEHTGLLAEGRCLRRNLKFKPDHLVVFSEETAQVARSYRPEQSLSVIPNGVDLERFKPEGDRIDLPFTGPTVLCVASLHRNGHKRVELAIKAVSQLPNVNLLICGAGVDWEYFHQLGQQWLGPHRFAIKTVPFNQMPAVYRSVDVFTLPSINEPFGLVYLEAMASGLPVVAPDDEMRRYLMGRAGIFCDVTNPDAYADAIALALEKKTLGRTARANAHRFSWDTLAEQYRDVIVQTIRQRRR